MFNQHLSEKNGFFCIRVFMRLFKHVLSKAVDVENVKLNFEQTRSVFLEKTK